MASASFGGTNYTLQNTPLIGTMPVASKSRGARVYCMSEECYATAVGDAGSHMYCGVLPRGANVLFSIVWPIDTATYGEGDAMTAAVTGQLGILASTTDKGDTITADPDLFGDIGALTTATPQVIEPVPDGTIHATTLDMPLRNETIPVVLTAAQALADTEGIALKMLYTMGGRT